jgi:hypothetical protein
MAEKENTSEYLSAARKWGGEVGGGRGGWGGRRREGGCRWRKREPEAGQKTKVIVQKYPSAHNSHACSLQIQELCALRLSGTQI